MRSLIPSAPTLLLPLLVVTLGQAPSAVAGTPADTLAAARLAREACDKDLPAQQQRLSAAPTDRALGFAVADCLYENGRYQVARETLDAAWRGADAAAFRPLGARGAEALALYAILLAHGQRAGEARALLDGARAAVGADPHLQRAAVMVRAYGGDRPGAWAELAALRQGAPHELAYLRATAELASLDPDGITPAAREVLAVRSSPDTRFNRAARHLNDRAPRACVEVVRQSLPELPEAERPRFRTLGYTCAVQADDLSAATALLKEVGPQQARGLPSDAVIGHARLIADAGDMATAVKLLGLTQPADAEQRGLAQTIRVRAATEAGDLGGALAAAASGEASPASMANLARALVTAGRIPEAEPLLDKACPQLKGEAAGQCYGYVEWMRKQKAKSTPPAP
ncbi:MAG: hypothetical protein RL071_1302 [Pseudomonadota bacterium]|jgi:thioredoxin-like negative regulator of GroEL